MKHQFFVVTGSLLLTLFLGRRGAVCLGLPGAFFGFCSTPFASRRGIGSTSPLIGLTIPATSLGSSESSRSCFPFGGGSGSEGTALDGSGANLLGTGNLLLLDLLLGLSLRVTVCRYIY